MVFISKEKYISHGVGRPGNDIFSDNRDRESEKNIFIKKRLSERILTNQRRAYFESELRLHCLTLIEKRKNRLDTSKKI